MVKINVRHTLVPISEIHEVGVLVIPVIGVVSGALVLGEPLTWREGAALLLILGAVALVVFRPGETGTR